MGRGITMVLAGSVALVLLAGCTVEVPASIGSARYHSVALAGDAHLERALKAAPVTVRFEREHGELDLIAGGPLNASTVPVSFDGFVVVPSSAGAQSTAVGCAGDGPVCVVDGWLSRFVSTKLTYRSSGSTLRLTAGAVCLTLRRD